jgi:hypothetical protein
VHLCRTHDSAPPPFALLDGGRPYPLLSSTAAAPPLLSHSLFLSYLQLPSRPLPFPTLPPSNQHIKPYTGGGGARFIAISLNPAEAGLQSVLPRLNSAIVEFITAAQGRFVDGTPSILVLEDVFDCETVFKTQL